VKQSWARQPVYEAGVQDDPALAVLEIHRGPFCHAPLTSLAQNKPPKHAALLKKMFSEWAKKKYATDEGCKSVGHGMIRWRPTAPVRRVAVRP
jgi:hypothetical protein